MSDVNNNQQAMPPSAGDIIASGDGVLQVQTREAMVLARQFPRDLAVVTRKAVQISGLAGEDFYYRWLVKNKDGTKDYVQGASVQLALEAFRLFGNCTVVHRPIQSTRFEWIFTAAITDLETGSTYERPYRMDRQFEIYGRMDKFRKDDIRFQIGVSKAARNAILNFMPQHLIDAMLEAAMNSVRNRVVAKLKEAGGDIEALIEPMMEQFAEYGVSDEMLAEAYAKPRDTWQVEELVMMLGDLKALKSRKETVETLFSKPEPTAEEEAEAPAASAAGDPISVQDMEPGPKKAKAKPKAKGKKK